jgi:hypothetical protein
VFFALRYVTVVSKRIFSLTCSHRETNSFLAVYAVAYIGLTSAPRSPCATQRGAWHWRASSHVPRRGITGRHFNAQNSQLIHLGPLESSAKRRWRQTWRAQGRVQAPPTFACFWCGTKVCEGPGCTSLTSRDTCTVLNLVSNVRSAESHLPDTDSQQHRLRADERQCCLLPREWSGAADACRGASVPPCSDPRSLPCIRPQACRVHTRDAAARQPAQRTLACKVAASTGLRAGTLHHPNQPGLTCPASKSPSAR